MGLDADDWADIIIPHIGLGVNPASKNVPYEPDAPVLKLRFFGPLGFARLSEKNETPLVRSV
jgi:hypothetical protein